LARIADPSGFFEMTMVEFYSHALIDHWETLTKEREKQMNYTAINIIANLKWNENNKP
jgi:hypothetical protein